MRKIWCQKINGIKIQNAFKMAAKIAAQNFDYFAIYELILLSHL